jgi:hypothetical protein
MIGWPGGIARKSPVFRARVVQQPSRPRRLPSHTFCVGTLDLASVSMTVRSISNSVRRTHSPVSTNVRQKTPLIARRYIYERFWPDVLTAHKAIVRLDYPDRYARAPRVTGHRVSRFPRFGKYFPEIAQKPGACHCALNQDTTSVVRVGLSTH